MLWVLLGVAMIVVVIVRAGIAMRVMVWRVDATGFTGITVMLLGFWMSVKLFSGLRGIK
jgi:hypothetical protein